MAVPCEVTAGQLTVRGLSIGGVETCLQIPQLDVVFDVGHCPRSFVTTKRLFITHAHGDHAGGLVGMLSHRLLYRLDTPLEVYAPAPICDAIRVAVAAWEGVQGHPFKWNLHPVEPGDEIPLSGGRYVRVFRSVHVIHCVDYAVWERVRKLKPEFVGLPGPEIAARKHAGEDLFDTRERPLCAFCGDTTAKVLDQQPWLLKTRVLILEATYLDDRRTVQQCKEHGHVHLDELIEHLVLTHFSQSYKPAEVREIVERRFTGTRPQVHCLLPETTTWPG